MTTNRLQSPLCQHLKNDGVRCGSPALRGKPFCFTHNRVHNGTQIAANHSCHVLPMLKSQRDIRVAATTILRDLRDGRIDYELARLMASTLRLANSTLKQSAKLDAFDQTLHDYRNLHASGLFPGN